MTLLFKIIQVISKSSNMLFLIRVMSLLVSLSHCFGKASFRYERKKYSLFHVFKNSESSLSEEKNKITQGCLLAKQKINVMKAIFKEKCRKSRR